MSPTKTELSQSKEGVSDSSFLTKEQREARIQRKLDIFRRYSDSRNVYHYLEEPEDVPIIHEFPERS